MTKVDIISGFLGAGKTTLISKLLKEALKDEQVVLIENEFGEIGIDGGFLKDSGVEIREMNSGCICCSLVGDFGTSLKEVVDKYHPDRIIIEPSGVGKLSDVIKAVKDLHIENEIRLNSASTVADASKVKVYMKNFGEFFNNQIENAGTVVLSRTDITDTAKIQKDVEMIREKNPKAAIVTTPLAELGGSQLLEIIEKRDTMLDDLLEEVRESHHHHDDDDDDCCCGHDHDHDADEVFTSWGKETTHKYTEAELNAALTALGDVTLGTVLRAKGIVPCADGGEWLHFDYVPGAPEIRRGAADYTGRLCVIGSELDEERIAALFGVNEK